MTRRVTPITERLRRMKRSHFAAQSPSLSGLESADIPLLYFLRAAEPRVVSNRIADA